MLAAAGDFRGDPDVRAVPPTAGQELGVEPEDETRALKKGSAASGQMQRLPLCSNIAASVAWR